LFASGIPEPYTAILEFLKPNNTYVFSFHRVRNRRELNTSLKGATLGDAEEDVDDTLKWIKRNKKKERELAKKRQLELENRDKEVQDEYTERELANSSLSRLKLTMVTR
jgi:hypothetical protein